MSNFLDGIRKVGNFILVWLLTVVVVSWNGGVLSMMWNWFVAPAIGQAAISLGTGVGLVLLFFLGRIWTVATWPESRFEISFGNAKDWMVKWLVAPLVILFLGAAVHFGIGTVILL